MYILTVGYPCNVAPYFGREMRRGGQACLVGSNVDARTPLA